MTQLSPRLTSALLSPCVATTRPSLVATMTPQPVPQNRQGALFHFSSVKDAIGDEILRRQLAPAFHPPPLPWQPLPVSGIHGGPRDFDPYGRLLPVIAFVEFFIVVDFILRQFPEIRAPRSAHQASIEMVLSEVPIEPVSDASITTTSLPFGSRL